MTTIVVSGIPGYDGRYELDDDRMYSTREWRWIKQISGYLPLTAEEGFKGADPDLFVALAVIAMNRDGKIGRDDVLSVAETLSDAPFDGMSITFDMQEADDTAPLPETSEPEPSLKNGSLEKPQSPGTGSRSGSVPSETTLEPTSTSRLHTSRI